MRYDTPVFFQKTTPGAYEAWTGNYSEDTVTEIKKYASVTDSGVESMQLIYDSIKHGSQIIRLQRPYKAPFDHVRIGEKVYKVDFSRRKKVFIVSEVQ